MKIQSRSFNTLSLYHDFLDKPGVERDRVNQDGPAHLHPPPHTQVWRAADQDPSGR